MCRWWQNKTIHLRTQMFVCLRVSTPTYGIFASSYPINSQRKIRAARNACLAFKICRVVWQPAAPILKWGMDPPLHGKAYNALLCQTNGFQVYSPSLPKSNTCHLYTCVLRCSLHAIPVTRWAAPPAPPAPLGPGPFARASGMGPNRDHSFVFQGLKYKVSRGGGGLKFHIRPGLFFLDYFFP